MKTSSPRTLRGIPRPSASARFVGEESVAFDEEFDEDEELRDEVEFVVIFSKDIDVGKALIAEVESVEATRSKFDVGLNIS